MYRINRERIKTYILMVLIALSIIQVGILLDYQSHGFPTNFLQAFLDKINVVSPDSSEKAREKYFNPYRVIASNGNGSHWLLPREGEAFTQLWQEGASYLSRVLDDKPALVLPAEEWENLVTKRTFIFEFKSNIDSNLLKWFLSKSGSDTPELDSVYKMAMLPWEDINHGTNTIYLKDGKAIYKYLIRFNPGGMDRDKYSNLMTSFETGKEYQDKLYKVIKELDPERKRLKNIDPDIPVAAIGPKFRSYKKLRWFIPENVSSMSDMAGIVLGIERAGYNRSIDIYDTIVFKTTDDVYRIFSNGLMEYKYIPGAQSDGAGDIGSAFMNAFRFIESMEKQLVSGADIYLSGMGKIEGGGYRFTFDYMVDNLPVVINYGQMGNDLKPVRNAIEITANGKRVLDCRWILKGFETVGREEAYNVSFEALSRSLNLSSLEADDLAVSYMVESDEAMGISPSWIIEVHDGQNIAIPLQFREGD
ncbi:MAG: hypothetical protein ACOX7R_09565 [Acetivibrionales bacterium]